MARGENAQRYYPGQIPSNIEDPRWPSLLIEFLRRELFAVYNGQEGVHHLPVLNAPPRKFQEGTLVYADGVNWDPGYGKGTYVYDGSAWVPSSAGNKILLE